jgi:hypothetical protein|tara:strand:+ start:1415 stop:1696 length:282 start_codon:yes stop_codon:yes gene_type:complete
MSKKYVYMVKTGGLSRIDDKFHFYNTEMFSSKKKALDRCQNGLDSNKAYNVDRKLFEKDVYQRDIVQIDFNCMNTDGDVEMKQRYWVEQIELK